MNQPLRRVWGARTPLALLGLVCCQQFLAAQEASETRPLRAREALHALALEIRDARLSDVAELAPAAFARVEEAYRTLASDAAAGIADEVARRRVGAIREDLTRAFARAEATKPYVAGARSTRGDLFRLKHLTLDRDRVREADQLLARALQAAEAGDEQEARRLSLQASTLYRGVALDAFARGPLAEITSDLGQARRHVPEDVLARAHREVQRIVAEVERSRETEIALLARMNDWRNRIDVVIEPVFPPFYRKPPGKILLGGFELVVERYDAKHWDFAQGVIVGADGLAWTSFDCGGLLPHPFPPIVVDLVPWAFRVVDVVRNPTHEISIIEARKLDPRAEVDHSIEIKVPKDLPLDEPLRASDLASRLQIPEGLLGIILLPPKKGAILVRFEDLTIQPTSLPGVGLGLAGSAVYPAVPRIPAELVIHIAGFKLHLDTLTITPATTTAQARLEMPDSIIDSTGCRVAEIDLGTITIDSSCNYHGEFLIREWGPWTIGDTGMVVQGIGFVVDLDTGWKWPGWSGFPQLPGWRGVILPAGTTVAQPSGGMISNIGYLKAAYSFNNGLVTDDGLEASFVLSAPFVFRTLLPFDFEVALQTGWLGMAQSRIQSGTFIHGAMSLPRLAVSDGTGGEVKAGYTLLTVQDDLDLHAEIDVKSDVFWGEYVKTAPELTAYGVKEPRTGHFFVAGPYFEPKLPLGPAGFQEPGPLWPIAAGLEAHGIHGAFLMAFEDFRVFTPDVPSPPGPLRFRPDGRAWVNVVGQGVHASLDMIVTDRPDADLGPTAQPFYVGNVPLHVAWAASPKGPPRYVASFQFVDSAVWESEASGTLDLKSPTNALVPFERLACTSTAHIPGASIDLTNPIVLDYWGVGVEQKPGFSSAGVMSVKTGQVILTAAGLTEYRHFAAPFWMTWMEILADGTLGRIFFDYNGSGQQFDGFPFTMEAIGLSAWNPADPDKNKAFLQTGGTAHFDFFGADYLNVKDFNHPDNPGPPFDGRRIELAIDTAFGTEPTDFVISGEWGNAFGDAEYTIHYDDGDQDGFLGTGTMGVQFILDGDMASTITLSRDLICMQVSETSRHDFKLGPIAHFGSMARISGCACIEDGELKRLLLSAELEASGNANIALRSGAYGKVSYLLTPSVSELRVRGNLYLSIVAGGDLEVDGRARFTVDRASDFVEGDVEGRFSSYNLLSGITAEGQLNWHLGPFGGTDSYQLIQGRLVVEVVAPVGGTGIEGGFFVGRNAPKEKAWTLKDKDGRFDLNTAALPANLTGIYGYVRVKKSVNLWVVSGGIEIFAGLGGFVNAGSATAFASGAGPAVPVALPFVVGNFGVRIWGDIAGGLVSASAWGNFQVIAPYPFQYQGTLGLEGCVLWVACASVDVTAGLNSAQGFYVN